MTIPGQVSRRQILIGMACAAASGTAVVAAPRRTEDRLKGVKLSDLLPMHLGPWSYEDAQNVVVALLRLAKITKDDVLWDRGCGDGRSPITAAKEYGCQARGFDIAH